MESPGHFKPETELTRRAQFLIQDELDRIMAKKNKLLENLKALRVLENYPVIPQYDKFQQWVREFDEEMGGIWFKATNSELELVYPKLDKRYLPPNIRLSNLLDSLMSVNLAQRDVFEKIYERILVRIEDVCLLARTKIREDKLNELTANELSNQKKARGCVML